jgi:transcription initiation factor TFIID subunit 15
LVNTSDPANFINFCTGKTLTNGQQVTGGSCNGIVMGDIPSQGNMVSSIIVSPAPGEDIAADTPFDITVQVANLAAGSFTNPQNTYYAAPQTLNGGKIVGHTHVTVQDLGNSLTPGQP